MRIPRIYHPQPLTDRAEIALSEDAANHVGRVLRMSAGRTAAVRTAATSVRRRDSSGGQKERVGAPRRRPRRRHRIAAQPASGRVISRGEKMEFTIQKSIELGVNVITRCFPSAAASNWTASVWRRKFSNGKDRHRRLRTVRP